MSISETSFKQLVALVLLTFNLAAADAGSVMAIASERILDLDSFSRSSEVSLRGGGKGGAGGPNWYNEMDFGPVLSDSISAAIPAGNLAIKGHAVRLADKASAQVVVGGMCFDSDLMRMSAGWTGAFLELQGVAYEGHHGVSGPKIGGTQIFGTPAVPGWSKSETFEDPRHEPFGPLPAEQAKYRGLYISGERVVFSYTLGGGTALELPGLEGDGKAVSRTIQLMNIAAINNLVAELPEATGSVVGGVATLSANGTKPGEPGTKVSAGLVGAPAGVTLAVVGKRIVLKVPALAASTFKLVITNLGLAESVPIIAAAKRSFHN